MVSEKQIKANKLNAENSTGPVDCSKTKYNAVKYGLTSKNAFTDEEEKAVASIYQDMSGLLTPKNILAEWTLGRIAIYIWRLQKSLQIEQTQFKNSLIRANNSEVADKLFDIGLLHGKSELSGETVDTKIDLVMRYEVMNENRLMKMMKFFKIANNK